MLVEYEASATCASFVLIHHPIRPRQRIVWNVAIKVFAFGDSLFTDNAISLAHTYFACT